MKTISKSLGHHKYGIKALKKVHQLDKLLLLTSAVQSAAAALFPYMELYFTTFIIDALIGKRYEDVPALIASLVAANLIAGLFIDMLNHVNTYKADKVHRAMIHVINNKAMELDFEEMEDAVLLQKISDASYIMEHIGGYNVFIAYYRQLAEHVIKIAASLAMIVNLSLLLPANAPEGIVSLISSVPFSFAAIVLMSVGNILASAYISKLSKTRTAKGYSKKMKVERVLNYYSSEVFMNYSMGKDIRLFNMLDLILGHHNKAQKESIDFYNRYYFDVDRNKETFNTISTSASTLGAYLVVMFKVLAGAITIGELSKYIGSITILNKALTGFIDVNQKIALQTEFIRTFDQFLEIRNTKADGTRSIQLDDASPCCIEFHHVSFRYKGSRDYTLKDISCKITSNSKTAIVGRNGAGKTTFIKLICRLYEPTEGYISLNGVDIREYRYEEYTALFSVVFQDFSLFSFPISENIAVTRAPEVERVWNSLSMVGLSDAVQKLPNTVETNLYKQDEDGINVSGGQAQKIAIARALYKDAPIVILDEPTAALDPISEYEIFSSFNSMVQGKTSLFISHRMGSCRFCEDILVFEDGRISQRGNHEELILDRDGLYAALYYAQADYYTKADVN